MSQAIIDFLSCDECLLKVIANSPTKKTTNGAAVECSQLTIFNALCKLMRQSQTSTLEVFNNNVIHSIGLHATFCLLLLTGQEFPSSPEVESW